MIESKSMPAFFGDPAIKQWFVDLAEAHRRADRIVQNYGYWYDGKGCAIGCLVEVDNNAHEVLQDETNIPIALSRIADVLFERMEVEASKSWAGRFIAAAAPGADLSGVTHRWLGWLVIEELPRHIDAEKDHQVAAAIEGVADLYRRSLAGETIPREQWEAARRDTAAAWRVADAAAAAAAAAAAWRVADAAAAAAAAAADAAAYAADAAAAAAVVAAIATAAAADAAAATVEQFASVARMADKLVELMAAA